MKRMFGMVVLAAALVAAGASAGLASRGVPYYGGHYGGYYGGHSHVGVGVVIGPGWWGVPYYPYPYPYYAAPPPVVRHEPDVYVQPEAPAYWYYCSEPEGYYPYLKKCPKGWMKVVPSPPPDSPESD